MASVIELCNMALGNIGVQQTIASLDEKSNEARACKRFYESARNELLRSIPWPFALRSPLLALVSENPTQSWFYSYRYPSDCEMVRRVYPSEIPAHPTFYRGEFLIKSDDSGKLIYSNEPLAVADITARISDTALFDSHFENALSWLVATKIAPSLTANNAPSVIKNASSMYESAMVMAGAFAMNEGQQHTSPYSEFTEDRQ